MLIIPYGVLLMKKIIGIARGLFYYEYFPLWNSFFTELGMKVVVSEKTNRRILDEGTKACVDEACLPVKLYFGHVLNIKDKVDCILIPRFTSISKNEYICPKFGGLPDMIKHSIQDLPYIIDTEVNLRKSKKKAYMAAVEIGKNLGFNQGAVKKAYKIALEEHKSYKKKIKEGFWAVDLIEKKISLVHSEKTTNFKIALISHGYNLYDDFINMNIVKKLKLYGADIITIDMLEEKAVNFHAEKLSKRMFWYFGRKAMGGIAEILQNDDIDAVIYLMAFGCGIDSFVSDLIERKIRVTTDIPFIALNLDEHSGEAGLDTRLEAFIDMIAWRRKNEFNISAYG